MGNGAAQRASNCEPSVEVKALGLVQLCSALGHGSGSSSHCTDCGCLCEKERERGVDGMRANKYLLNQAAS